MHLRKRIFVSHGRKGPQTPLNPVLIDRSEVFPHETKPRVAEKGKRKVLKSKSDRHEYLPNIHRIFENNFGALEVLNASMCEKIENPFGKRLSCVTFSEE